MKSLQVQLMHPKKYDGVYWLLRGKYGYWELLAYDSNTRRRKPDFDNPKLELVYRNEH